MIGLSTIACLNGGRGRIAPTATALGILICVSCAYKVLNYIPMAALAGIMIVVVLHTFKWFSVPIILSSLMPQRLRKALNFEKKIPRTEAFVILGVTLVA